MELFERVRLIRKTFNLTQEDFANKIGLKQASYASIETGRVKSISESVMKLLEMNYNISRDWLLFNKGNMILEDVKIDKPNNQPAPPKGSGVPYYDIDVTASLVESFSDIQEEPEFYVDFKPFNDCSAYLPVYGDSMYPMIASGEIVALKKIEHTEYIQYGEPHLIITNSESNNMRTIKIIRKAHDKNMIILKPSNPNFDEMEIPRNTIIGLYIVKGKITRKQL